MEYNPKTYYADYDGNGLLQKSAALSEISKVYVQEEKKVQPPVKVIAAKLDFVTTEEIETLKENINDSFSECVNLYLELRRDLDLILERLDKHNSRSGHKI